MMKRKKNEAETSEKVMKAERRGRAGRLSISARDFAEFAVLYEDSCECDAFGSIDDTDVHGELIDASTELLDAVSNAVSSRNPRSIEELCLVLDLAVGPGWNGKIQAGFWTDVLACLGSREDCFSVELMAVTFSNLPILVAGIQAGFFDRHVLADDLASFLHQLSECHCNDDAATAWLNSGAGLLEIARSWEARRAQLI